MADVIAASAALGMVGMALGLRVAYIRWVVETSFLNESYHRLLAIALYMGCTRRKTGALADGKLWHARDAGDGALRQRASWPE